MQGVTFPSATFVYFTTAIDIDETPVKQGFRQWSLLSHLLHECAEVVVDLDGFTDALNAKDGLICCPMMATESSPTKGGRPVTIS